ncbi:hypothetical protein [Maribellus sp. YY47]|uniref:hypothetical protein n=1 Tax=Maribellus sp. YY47 TaxID=2929486 RepID=UPI002001B606|nr:hypothetical protein [Maribellus sp. YY47]MCK3685093.1 hypothetical protein [Maribellus sp. YY47]
MKYQIKFENEVLSFQLINATQAERRITLNLGYRTVAETFFKHLIPNEAEIDHAINFIEDEIMRHNELFEANDTLFTSDNKVVGIFSKNGLSDLHYSRQTTEDLFSSYARVIMGAPASLLNAEITRDDVAIILILREVMHHLGFTELTFIS